jgi:hypothetical protein
MAYLEWAPAGTLNNLKKREALMLLNIFFYNSQYFQLKCLNLCRSVLTLYSHCLR